MQIVHLESGFLKVRGVNGVKLAWSPIATWVCHTEHLSISLSFYVRLICVRHVHCSNYIIRNEVRHSEFSVGIRFTSQYVTYILLSATSQSLSPCSVCVTLAITLWVRHAFTSRESGTELCSAPSRVRIVCHPCGEETLRLKRLIRLRVWRELTGGGRSTGLANLGQIITSWGRPASHLCMDSISSKATLHCKPWVREGMGGEGRGWYVEMEEETLQHPCKCRIVPPWMGWIPLRVLRPEVLEATGLF